MNFKKLAVFFIITIFLLSNCLTVFGIQIQKTNNEKTLATTDFSTKKICINLSFSEPEVEPYNNYSVVRVNETNHNQVVILNYKPGKPVLPVNLSVFNLEFDSDTSKLAELPNPPKIKIINNARGMIFFICQNSRWVIISNVK